MAEFTTGDERTGVAEKSGGAYEEAMKECDHMKKTSAIRLGLALNYSVFHYEIKNDCVKACEVAKQVRNSVSCLCSVIFKLARLLTTPSLN